MLYIFLFFIFAFLDQASKFLTVKYLCENESVCIIQNILKFTRCHNTGGPWSILNDSPVFFIAFSVIIFILGFVYLKKHKLKHPLSKLSVSLIAGGAVGNFIDRIFRGYVVDMIDIDFFNYPVFNVADTFIVIGAVLLCVYVLFICKDN